MNYKLSPSDLTFLYDGCKHCFVLKVKYGIQQPSIPLPSIFSIIASLQKTCYSGKRTEEFCSSLPPGEVVLGEKWVRSKTIQLSGCKSTCYLSGRFDIVSALDNGAYAILDFKTGNPSEEKSAMYARQLQAYAYSLENPEPGSLELKPITHLGLLYFIPDNCEQIQGEMQNLKGPIKWIPIERDETQFIGFLGEVIKILDGPIPQMDPDNCDWCKYRTKIGEVALPKQDEETESPTAVPIPSCPLCNGEMRLRSGKYGEFWSCLKFPSCRGTRNL
jgi:hypothetical protein